jgi:hypothetical protein
LREISRSEALVVAELLAGSRTHGDGSTSNPLPRRTRQVIHHRLVARDSLKERYVPNPAALGRPIVTFALAQPYAEMHPRATATWQSQQDGVDLWSFKDTLFGVFFLKGAQEARALRGRLGDPLVHRSIFFLDCDSRVATVPVFFDFGAVWAEITGLQDIQSYPHPLPSYAGTGGNPLTPVSNADRGALHSLMTRQLIVGDEFVSRAWMNRLAQGARERRLVRRRVAEFRTFLDPAACSRWVRNFPEGVAFVQGTLVEGGTAPELFHGLVEDCRVSPFLFATDGGDVLFGCLSKRVDDRERRPSSIRTPMSTMTKRFLSRIVVLREPLTGLSPLVDHRYDRPFSQPNREGESGPAAK